MAVNWDKFDEPLLPPIVEPVEPATVKSKKVIVYLPFEDIRDITACLTMIDDYQFYIYHPEISESQDLSHMHLRPTSYANFRNDFRDCASVICGAGFELASECLVAGKRLLVKAQENQMEQASNACALNQLGYGNSIRNLKSIYIERWLKRGHTPVQITYPNVAQATAHWITGGDWSKSSLQVLSNYLWRQVSVNR
jgi:uncharacterized protein (TIGR00661 family)